ncbi:AAA family ATPase [Pyxidicoccus fallax]|uniref:AAA family ATPase n=1 Tax=Pyxidicoccus fallax TaxID=394095 RepID=A0A848LUX9_9BACT|nr:AAA family ATPase [Pyxidicoccus fallax]NMO21868.1 AAA family ATPase [Pyxidicoccus fallax]NPC85896.1 AAA family ATPase [Pyxidicoccus fallax]
MYLTRFTIENLRAIQKLEWKVPLKQAPGWHVILGDNGSGKSSVLRSIALALVGPYEATALRQDWEKWRRGNTAAGVQLSLALDARYDRLKGKKPGGASLRQHVGIVAWRHGGPLGWSWGPGAEGRIESPLWESREGWFSAAFGPFRRFTGGNEEYEKLLDAYPRLARHLSVFDESVALTEGLKWLQQLQFKKLERDPEGRLLAPLMKFINQPDFLPHRAHLEKISSREVLFVDGNGFRVPVEELSDGYRAVLSMTFELIRQLAAAYGPRKVFNPKDPTRVDVPGVVLIDEVDAHLHPTWQRKVGLWFRKHFPKMQFIVTTHSPLVCQAAEEGTVWRLPRPGTAEEARQVTGVELERLVYGNVLDAYGTGVFGEGITRSERAKERLQRLAELNMKELKKGLTPAERKEQAALRASQPTAAMTLNASEARGRE